MRLQGFTSIFLLFILLHSDARAEDAYRWRDEKGNILYGSKPPQNAQNIEKFTTRTLSRYSTDKVLQRLGEVPSISKENSVIEKNIPISQPSQLKNGDVTLEFDDQHRVTSCKVSVKNTGEVPATGVVLSFEFPGGALIPAIGPEQIAPSAEEMYIVSPELLPISGAKFFSQDEKRITKDRGHWPIKNEALKPKVIIRHNQN